MRTRGLDERQRELLGQWLGRWSLVADHSWGLTDMTVLEVASDAGRMIVKAAGPQNVHIGREIRAHQEWTGAWVREGRAARLVASDETAGILATTCLPGALVQGSPTQDAPDTYRQAGSLIATFHAQHSEADETWNHRLLARVERFLAQPHRIEARILEQVLDEIARWPTGAAMVVPTHGDWAPRNWLWDRGAVLAIDFGRCALRVPEEDFVRLSRQDFHRNPALETAFFDGYGHDPRDPDMWRRVNVAEAAGTAVWAHQVGDLDFEALGHAHLARLYPD